MAGTRSFPRDLRAMETGSSSKPAEEARGEQAKTGVHQRPGPWLTRIEPFVPRRDHNPGELKSWARRTGFNPNISGETASLAGDDATVSNLDTAFVPPPPPPPLPAAEKAEIEPMLGRGRRVNANYKGVEIGSLPTWVNTGDVFDGEPGELMDPNLKEKRRVGVGAAAAAEKAEIKPLFGRGRRVNANYEGMETVSSPTSANVSELLDGEPGGLMGSKLKEKRRVGVEPSHASLKNAFVLMEPKNKDDNVIINGTIPVAVPVTTADGDLKKDDGKIGREVEIDMFSDYQEAETPLVCGSSGLKCSLTDNPGYANLVLYGLQHYLSMASSLVLIPLITVPAMGGTGEETATVISTMLLVSGLGTILHSFLGIRLPLIHGSSFVYLAPALVIINSENFLVLNENRFRHIMRELQGAILVGSVFQIVLGYSGLMSLLLRLINPVVVAPTVASVGLAFFSLGFPQAGTCAEISIPLLLLILIFTLYLRRVSIFRSCVFLIFAVPLSIAIVWAYAFFLTAGGAYNYKGCNPTIPTSNILSDSCQRHVSVMKHCRTDVSNAWRNASWLRIPYPFQWGSPTFHYRTCIVMIIASLVASVDSVGTYHRTSLLVRVRAPTPGIVSRGIGLEGITSLLAGLWGTGIGLATLTENVYTLEITKVASRRAIEFGAAFLIVFSFFGKVGALLASIPLALAASVLCFTWALIVALGLSTLQYTQAASSRNILIVGFTLFISLSIPAYFQQYPPTSSLVLPSYLVPFAAASDGPVHLGNEGLNYTLNALVSLNMVVALLVSFVLDNTVPGSKQERGVYIWSKLGTPNTDLSVLEAYALPKKMRCFFKWAKWVGS